MQLEARSWAAGLWRALASAGRSSAPAAPAAPAALEDAVELAWGRVRQAHPSLSVAAADWFVHVGSLLRAEDPAVDLLARHLGDLYLAYGCAREDAAALQIFEHQILAEVARKLAYLRLSFSEHDDLMQSLRERMLVAVEGRRGISAYDGRAPLVIWLRVVAARLGQRQAHRDRRAQATEDHQLDQLAPGVADPSLAYLKRHYGAQFRAAFAEAVASLSPRERNLLRHAVIDELSIDQLAAIYHVHRATAARQLKQAREALIAATRERMRATLRVNEEELESILRGIMSMTDVTLRQVLAKGRARAATGE
jgi:RNA polymerase sigma-70 factor, ECF subfamily